MIMATLNLGDETKTPHSKLGPDEYDEWDYTMVFPSNPKGEAACDKVAGHLAAVNLQTQRLVYKKTAVRIMTCCVDQCGC